MSASASSSLVHWSPDAPFCPLCGSLLVFPDGGDVSCDACPFVQPLSAFPHAISRSISHPKAEPEWLVEARMLAAAQRGDVADVHAAAAAAAGGAKNALVNEECPKCKNPQMEYWTMQTRVRIEGVEGAMRNETNAT